MTGAGRGRLKVLLGAPGDKCDPAFETVLDLEDFAGLVRSGRLLGHIGRYRDVVAHAAHADAVPRPLAVATCLRLMSRGRCSIETGDGARREVTLRSCFAAAAQWLRDRQALPDMRARVLAQLTEFERLGPRSATTMPQLGRALHLRTDLWLGVQAGGAVAHTAGIANAFAARGMAPVLAAFERNPILSAAVDERLLPLPDRFWDFPEMPAFFANTTLETSIEALLDEVRPALIYHRLAAFSFAGAQAARQRGLPMIVEYNGSEAWIARHWGRPFREEELALRIETAVLRAADRVVAVSAPLRDELIRKGVPDERIRMVMNGVNTGHFRSDIDATPQRLALGIDPEHVVMGFIGSFGVWHGVPVLVEAYARMLDQQPQLRRSTRLLLVGDGIERPKVEARIAALGLNDNVVMTGLVAQEKAPAMLAAADILVAPHVPNTDGSSFFGSPTKLFEYMSMGRCIVASQLDQIGDVLVDDRTALLAAPGEAHALADALIRAVGDPLLRSRLGGAARAVALAQHDWRVRLDEILR